MKIISSGMRASLPLVTLAPLGNAGDAARLQSAFSTSAGVRGLYLGPGTFALGTTTITLPSHTVVELHPSAVLSWAMPTDLSNSWFGLYATPATDATVTATTLSADVVLGVPTIVTVGPVAVGKWLRVNMAAAPAVVQLFKVLATSGAGPYTLTIDVPPAWSFVSGDTVAGVIPPRNITISGGQFAGTGSRAIQIGCAVGCTVEGARISGSWDWGAGSFDLGGRRNAWRDIVVSQNTGAHGGSGIAIEGNVGSLAEDIRIDGAAGVGVYLSGSRQDTLRRLRIQGTAGQGVFLDTQPSSDNTGTRDADISDVQVSGATGALGYGVLIADGSARISLRGVTATGCAQSGIILAPGSTLTPSDITLTDCHAFSSSLSGIYVNGAPRVKLIGCSAGGSGAGNVTADADLRISGAATVELAEFSSLNPSSQMSMYVSGTANVQARGLRLHVTRNGLWFGLLIDAAGVVAKVNGVVFTGVAGQNHQCIANGYGGAGGTLTLSEASAITISTTGYNGNNADTLRRGPNVVLPSIVGANLDFGTVTATATVTSTAILASDNIVLTRTVDGGTITFPPKVVVTAGQLVVTYAALDTSTYAWRRVP